MSPLYTSPAMRLGKQDWRVVVRPFYLGGYCTEYQFRSSGADRWRTATEWPGYDGDDTYNGLPRSLERLYRKHHAEVRAALAGEPSPQAVLL